MKIIDIILHRTFKNLVLYCVWQYSIAMQGALHTKQWN